MDDGRIEKEYIKEFIWYYFGDGGSMTTGWRKIDGKWYHFNEAGIMQYGKQKINGKYYMLNYFNGEMTTGWYNLTHNFYHNNYDIGWYYSASDGVMQTGWVEIDGKWYYLAEKEQDFYDLFQKWKVDIPIYHIGRMYCNGSFPIDGVNYLFDSNGVCRNR